MNDSIKQLLAIQQRDSDLDKVRAEAAAIPAKIADLKAKIQANKVALESAKKDLTQFHLAKKQKDLDLETQENAIRKHSGELNAVKSNDAYKALLGEIEKAKRDKSALEDQILQVMEQIDQATKVWKEKEASAKGIENDLLKQVSAFEAQQKALEQDAANRQTERDAVLAALPANLSGQYTRLRGNKRTDAIVPLRNEQCMGCHMKVSQNLIREVRRAGALMTCEQCSRIVYLEEAPAANATAASNEAP